MLSTQSASFIIFAFVLSPASTFALDQHLICKTVNGVFTATNTQSTDPGTVRRDGVQGVPGKRGPIGPRGVPGVQGLKGDEGHVDYNNISDIVERKVCEGLSAIALGLDDLRKDITEFRRNVTDQLSCVASGLVYNGTCYVTPHISATGDFDYDNAVKACQNMNAELAEIQDKSHQESMEIFVRAKMPSQLSLIYLWIGMNYNSSSRTVRYKSTREVSVSHFTWWPGYPGSGQYMVLGVKRSGSDGVWNSPGSNLHGVICQLNM